MEKYFKVNFKAQLVKFVLAFKTDCSIDIFWKKGEKIAQSAQVPFSNASAYFNETLTISCNMVFDVQSKAFKQKITKFQIILYTQRGNKKVGEIHFDVSNYLNERLKTPKEYELSLQKCPDKNSKLSIKLTASIEKEIQPDAISNSSANTVNVETIINNNVPLSQISKSSINVSPNIPTKDVSTNSSKIQKKLSTVTSIEEAVSKNNEDKDVSVGENTGEKNKNLEQENKKIREQLKNKEKLIKENQELKKKIKNEEYDSIRQLKQKIENGRKQLQRLQSTIKKQVLLQKEVKGIQQQIFKCKFQIMSAFNYANEKGGGKLMFEMQQACGLKQM